MNTPSKITAIMENKGEFPANISYEHKSLPSPDTEYMELGKEGTGLFYINTHMPPSFYLDNMQPALLDEELDSLLVEEDELVGAIYDVKSDQPLQFTIFMLPAGSNTLKIYKDYYTFVPKDGHNRLGTFQNNSKISPGSLYSYSTADGAKVFEIASNLKYSQNDPPLTGIIPQTGQSIQLMGNYGVTYSINVNALNPAETGKRLSVLLSPRGGEYAGFIRFRDDKGNIISEQYAPFPVKSVLPPNNGVVCGFINLAPGATTSFTIDFMPAGSTSLPVWLMLIPL